MTSIEGKRPYSVWIAFIGLGALSATLAVFAAILMTQPGQILNLDRDWIMSYHRHRFAYGLAVLALYGGFVYLGRKYRIWRIGFLALAGAGVVAPLYVANPLLDHFFPTEHKTAVYVSVDEADHLLSDQETVYAAEIGGEAVAYPRRFLMIPHVAGKTIGGAEVAMTYCALSDVPVVYGTTMGGRETNLGVLIQTNNNLVLYDDNSGEVIQQLTGRTEFGSPAPKVYANQMMNAVRLAEDFATLDVLSDGRAEMWVGKGVEPRVYEHFGQKSEEAVDRQREGLELLSRLWLERQVNWEGRFRPPLRDVTLEPRCVQSPAVPI